ncbi:Redoxin [Phialemonium atrogriseum]|uniref:Thioredoxin peroxidase n=1 Tax=Phialemonium atrogriseum TaxID=1093897 RepID=A0AAJ0FIP2_9PEZI|nr:Redoxin [Phialemonium atrogriseum]KAK1763529.1 Redoxin [Phialemonium atrogriseum]
MSALNAGDSFPEGVTFTYIPYTEEKKDLIACGIPIKYDASKEFSNKKVVLVAVPGAFTPTCQEQHVVSYIRNATELKAKGVDHVVIIASNDAFVMSAWGKANGVSGDFIIFASDAGLEFSKRIGWTAGDRTLRYAVIVDHGKVTYAEKDVPKSIAASGAEGVLAKL